jgi:hypothetical protein
MDATADPMKRTPGAIPRRTLLRRVLRGAATLIALLLAAVLLAGWLLQPRRAGATLLALAGNALGLQLRAQDVDYRLRGTPQLVLREVEARRPGDSAALLKARRAFVSLPWRTLRSRGADLTVQRIELDAPVLDIPALQRWLATRPPSGETRIPVLTDGLRVREGRIDNGDWRIDGLAIDLPALHPQRPLRARVRGRYLDAPLAIPADLAIAVAHPQRLLDGAPTGVAGVGRLTLAGDGWQVPAQVFLAGPLRLGRDSALVKPARVGIAARYLSGSTNAPFRLGLHGPMAFNNATWRFVPVTVVLDGDGPVPDARARGSVSVGGRLRLHLDGALAGWPQQWPALPLPLSASTSPLPFALDYNGAMAFSDAASLSLRRDATALDARFRLPEVLAWLDAGNHGSPLPPLVGTLSTPRVEMAGATLEGVEVELGEEEE